MSTEKKEVVLVARSLGEGIITKCLKRYAFIDEERLGKIYVPVEACLPSSQTCNDLRDIFKENDCVVFTAQRRNPASNDCNYFANSIIKKSDLILVEGRIVEVNEKYAYSETAKYGRIFMPFSAKNEYNRPWVGRGAAIDKKITMKIMPQPEVNKCHYVAWAVFVDFCLANGANRSLSALMLTNPSPLSLNCGSADDHYHNQSTRHSVDDSPSLTSTEWPMYCITTDSSLSSSRGRVLERQAEVVLNLLAIVIAPAPPPQNSVQETANNWALTTQNREMLAYAPQTGLVRIGVCEDVCPVGSFVFFDAQKCLSIPTPQTPGTPSTPKLQQQQASPQQNNREKCTWMATSIEPVGELIEVIPGCASRFVPYNEERLTVEVDALVCRVSKSNNSAWLWNDLIGRIFVNGHAYRAGMRSLEMVRCRCQFTASFEDVPWSAIDIQLLGDNPEKRNEFSQLLLTDDGWKVQYVNEQQSGTFFGFMIHEEHGSAFVAWTDTIGGDAPPAKGDICRATLYRQLRDRKHQWRAVMVSKMALTTVKDPEEAKKVVDALNRRHPLWPTSGRLAPQFLAKRSPDGRNVIRLVGGDVGGARKSSSGSVVADSNCKKKLSVKGSGGRNGQVTTPTSFADAAGASAARRADSPVATASLSSETAEPRSIAAIGSQRMKKPLQANGSVAVILPPPGFPAPSAIGTPSSVRMGGKMSSRIYSSESSDGSSPHEATGNTSNGVVLGGGGTTAYEFDAKFFQSTIPISGVNDTTANTSPITFDAVGLCGLRATNGGDGGKQDANILPYDGRDKAWQELRAISVSSPPQQPLRNGGSPWAFDGGGVGSPFIDINNGIGKDSPTLFLPSLIDGDLRLGNGGDSNGNFPNGVTSKGGNPSGGFNIINNNTNIIGDFNNSTNGGIGGFKPDVSLFNAFMSLNNGGISDSSLTGSNCDGDGLLHRAAAVTSKDAGTQTEMDIYDMLSVALRHRQHLFKRFFQENAEIRQLLREFTTEKYATNNIKQ